MQQLTVSSYSTEAYFNIGIFIYYPFIEHRVKKFSELDSLKHILSSKDSAQLGIIELDILQSSKIY